jgi:C4-type Zn-finger protein
MDRLVQHIQEIWDSFVYPAGEQGERTEVEWLPAKGVAMLLQEELGYSDEAELEDALRGTFVDFLRAMPHINTRVDPNTRAVYFQVIPEPPRDRWVPRRHVVPVRSRQDLVRRVCLKSRHARIVVPSLEFEISPDGTRRHIDSLYNHITTAITNLGAHVRTAGASLSEEHKERIMETVVALNALLDVDEPWEFVVSDPSGASEVTPMEGVTLIEGEEAARADAEDAEKEAQEKAEREAAAARGGAGTGAGAGEQRGAAGAGDGGGGGGGGGGNLNTID